MVCASLYGVIVNATVSFASCNITGNSAYNVRPRQPVIKCSSGRHGRAWSCGGMEGTPVPLAVGARVRHRPWHPSSHGRGHHPPLALQDGGVVYASQTSVNGTATVSFESCTITGNSASQVHLRQPAMKRSNDRHGA